MEAIEFVASALELDVPMGARIEYRPWQRCIEDEHISPIRQAARARAERSRVFA